MCCSARRTIVAPEGREGGEGRTGMVAGRVMGIVMGSAAADGFACCCF